MAYTYNESAKTLDASTPLVTRDGLLLICKEIDEDTPEAETTSFISTAHTLICELLDGYGVSTSLLTEIEKYLAAHFATLSYNTVQREGLGPLSRSYAVKLDKGLDYTRYGQQAVSLDPTGVLKNVGKLEPSIRSIGNGIIVTEESD